ncbi:MAG: universal stress protein, partial [Actinoplanes sp.]
TRVVVGVDGSSGSAAAVRWAAIEARLRQTELRVLTAFQRKLPARHAASSAQTQPSASAEAAAIIHDAVAQARSAAPGVDVRGVALPGYAVPVLLHAEEDAALLVVGSHRGGGMPGLPHGSVCSQVATHARGSVVVVRGGSAVDGGPVVVGVGDDPAAGTVIDRAFEEASLRSAPVVAVTAASNGGRPADDDLAPWRERFPAVVAEREVIHGKPDKVLVQRCREAQLVVVGPRRHGFEGVMLGPVGTRLLQRAECPVLVARS